MTRDDRSDTRSRGSIDLVFIDLESTDDHKAVGGLPAQAPRIVLAAQSMSSRLRRELKHGASALVTLLDPLSELERALDAVAVGDAYVSKSAARLLFEALKSAPASDATRVVELSARDRDVLRLLVDGMTAKAMARALGISLKTVEAHRSRLFAKLNVTNRAQAVARAANDPTILGL